MSFQHSVEPDGSSNYSLNYSMDNEQVSDLLLTSNAQYEQLQDMEDVSSSNASTFHPVVTAPVTDVTNDDHHN
ncbi:unnamed protein product [Auanema sp. JU1783]|nr:unnamed protein product [Auanema sp. JU1783]